MKNGCLKKMALLLATNDWKKMDVFMRFLSRCRQAVWRTRLQYTVDFLNNITYPLNIYFFHRNVIKYRAKCLYIRRSNRNDWPLTDSPPEYRSDLSDYKTFVVITKLEKVKDTHIGNFPKWDMPKSFFEQGQLGILRVIDIYTHA